MNIFALGLVLLTIGVAFWFFRDTVLLVFLAILLAILMNMPVQFLTRLGVPRLVAIPIGILLCLGILFLVFLSVLPAIITVSRELIGQTPAAVVAIQAFYETQRSNFTWLPETAAILEATQGISATSVLSWVLGQLGGVAGMLGQALLLVVISVFILIAPAEHKMVALKLFPAKKVHRVRAILDMIYQGLTAWMRALGMSIAATFTLVFASFTAIGFPFAFEIAVITAVATFIPTLGAILPIIPIIIFGITAPEVVVVFGVQTSPIGLIGLALGLYFLIQQFEGNVITPSFHRAELNILPAGILLFQIVSLQLFGVLGVLMAVPILVIVIVLVRELYSQDVMGWPAPVEE